MPEPRRPWCALCEYPGRARFLFGTAWTLRTEGEEAARAALLAALASVLPTLPEIVEMHPGQIVFTPEGAE